MKKVLSILLAVLMVASMFSVVAFAEGEAEEVKVMKKYAGGTSANSYSYREGRPNKAWKVEYLNPDGRGKAIIEGINKDVASGDYAAYYIYIQGGSTTAITISDIIGTEKTPVYIEITEGLMTAPLFASDSLDTKAPAITLEDCEYVTLKGIAAKSSIYNGIEVRNCKNVTLENIEFKNVGYTDYSFPSTAEDGTETYPDMDTTNILAKGSALLIGEGNTDIAVIGCKFENCRAGVVVDSTKLEVEEEPAPAAEGEETEEAPVVTSGVSITDCSFTNINEAGVILNGADDVTVSGGKATNVGTLTEAQNYDGTAVAVVKVVNSKDAIVEKMFSSYNVSFVNFEGSTGKVRFNVSDGDGAGKIGEGVLVYNNTFVNASALEIATAYNNIFSMVLGEKVKVGEGDANCYYWTSKGNGGFKKNPRFANAFDGMTEGQDPIDNYRLSTESACLGAGVKCDDDMGTTDFYGNELGSSINVGADQGAGAEPTVELVSDFVDFFNYIFAVIKNFFENLFK